VFRNLKLEELLNSGESSDVSCRDYEEEYASSIILGIAVPESPSTMRVSVAKAE